MKPDPFKKLLEKLETVSQSKDSGYPISADHCFLRVAYDALFPGPWDQHIGKPAWKHLDSAQTETVRQLLSEMLEYPEICRKLNVESLKKRRSLKNFSTDK